MASNYPRTWSACMIRLFTEDQTLTEDELREMCEYEELDDAFNKSQDSSESLIGLDELLASLLIGSTIYDILPETNMEIPEAAQDNFTLDNFIDTSMMLPEDFYDETQYSQYEWIMEEARQYGRIEDPATQESIIWRNQEAIADKMAMFGDTEADKQGQLDIYTGYSLMIPWTTCEDNDSCETDGPVCEECEDLRGELFLPDDFPEPPHYGCRCNVPMADPELV